MSVEMLATYPEWKQNFLEEVNALPHNVAKGDEFVVRAGEESWDSVKSSFETAWTDLRHALEPKA